MKFLKTHYGRALPIPPDTDITIPFPGGEGLSSETNGNVDPYHLFDNTAEFTTNVLGNIVITSTGGMATVVGFVGHSEIILDQDIASNSGTQYKLYTSSPNSGFSIYIPKGVVSDLDVTTIGGDRLTFYGLGDDNASMIVPVACLTVKTSSDKLIALW